VTRPPARNRGGPGQPVQFAALRYFALDGTDHEEQASMIRRYII
jgi:hypothetical protein